MSDTDLFFCLSAKPISLVERCYCRSTVNSLPRGYIRELRFIHTPNCPFQVMWVLFLLLFYCFTDWHPHKHVELHVVPGLKTSDRFPPCWTFLTINLWEATGQRKELCMHVYAHAPLSLASTHMHREQVVFTASPLTHPQEVLHLSMSERERKVEIGCSFVFNRKAIIVAFVIGFASYLLVTQRFLLILCF